MMKNIYLLFILLFANAAFSQTVTVNSLADDGSSGTLRWAILQANGDIAIDKINFDSGLNGTITLTSNLPNISQSLTIEGPGTSVVSISGNNAYNMFVVNQSVTLTISGLTFTRCGSSPFQSGSMFYANRSTVIADNILVSGNTRSTPFYSKDGGSLISITNSTFSNNSSTLFGSDYGNTPSTTDSDLNYSNRIMVSGSSFTGNSGVIFSTERFVKIDNCTFSNNTGQIGQFNGLNRYQVINSTFNNNTGWTLFSFSSTLSSGTFFATLGDNHHLFDSNTFSGNTNTIINSGSTNEQQRTTITNNTFINNGTNWTGSPKVVSGNSLDNFITSVSHNLSNSTITVNMSKALYSAINSTGSLDVNDFQFSLTGGNATLVSSTPSSLTVSGNSYTLGIQLNGFTSGEEVLKVIPIVNSIYDSGNNIAGTVQKNSSVTLSFLDDDQDGVANFIDQCPNTPTTSFANLTTGCPDPSAGKIWNGPYKTITKADGADFTLPANQDTIINSVVITRGNSQGLFNISNELSYNRSVSPNGTQWARVDNDGLTTSQIRALTFQTWVDAFQNSPPSQINRFFLVFLPAEKIYFYVKLLSWSSIGSGGFSYQRSTIPNSAPTALALSTSTLAENSAIGTVIGTLSSTDGDTGDTHTYSLVSGTGDTDNASFEIVSGALRVKEVFNFETKPSYSIRIRSTDSGNLNFEQTFNITVSNVNEAPTALALSTSTLAENSAIGTVIGTLSSTDSDAGDTHTYSLVSGTGDTDNISFELSGNQLKVKEVFNFETKPSYSIRIRSTDSGNLNFEQTFNITVSNVNEAPTALALSTSTIAENSAIGTVIGTLSSTDSDAGDTHTYSLVSGTGDTDNASFEIVSGALRVKEVFNFETKPSYSIRIRSTDSGNLNFEQTFNITVSNVNEAPTALALSTSTLAENSAIGTVIGTLSSTDSDAGDTHTYSLVSGTGDTDNISFELSGNQLKVKEVFNFETKPGYSIRIRSTDSGNLNFEQTFNITVSNVNEAPTALALSTSTLAENSAIGTVIGTLSSTDSDAGDTHTYTLVSGAGDTDNASFEIVSGALKVKEVFNFETKPGYSIRIRSTDSGNLNFEQTFNITVSNVNEAPTALALSTSTLAENSAIGTVIGTLSSTDSDAGDTHTYSLVSGTGDTDNISFELSGNQLKVKEVFNFETKPGYSIRVRSTDSGNLNFEQTFNITVSNVNEAPTALALSTSTLAENSAIGTVIGTLSSRDADTGDTHTYTLVSGAGDDDNQDFMIRGNELLTKRSFDYENIKFLKVRVRSVDSGQNQFEESLMIQVMNVNEVPVKMIINAGHISENDLIGTKVGILKVTDPDEGDKHTFSFITGIGDADNHRFSIKGDLLLTNEVFDYEKRNVYTIRVKVSDDGGLSYEEVLPVNILDVNEQPSEIIMTKGNVYEANEVGETVAILKTNDVDSGDSHTYSFVNNPGSNDHSEFRIVGNQIQASKVYKFSEKSTYRLVVRSTDKGGLFLDKELNITISQTPIVTGTGTEPYSDLPTAANSSPKISKGSVSKLNVQGTDIVSYQWTPSLGLSSTAIANPEATPQQTTRYTVELMNRFGSSTKVSINIEVMDDFQVKPSNIMTPNGDGENDFWIVENLPSYPNNELTIFASDGKIIYRRKDYANDWNGQLNGVDLPTGTYYYILTFNGGKGVKKGSITIVK